MTIRLLAISMYLTAGLRLVPLPISDTVRFAVLAFVILLLGSDRKMVLSIVFFQRLAPLLLFMLVPTLFNILFRDFGFLATVIWVQFLSGLMVANTVYNLEPQDQRRLIVICAIILLMQLAFLKFMPGAFAARGRAIGIEDNFVTWGAALDRVYFAYYQANAAAYSIFFMLLSWCVIGQRTLIGRWQYFAVGACLLVLIQLTGSRGALLLSVGFLVAWLLAFRSTGGMVFVTLATLGGALLLPLYNAVMAIVLLRERSNEERLEAIGNYIGFIRENPLLGMGLEALRTRSEVEHLKPSHLFFVEILGIYGVLFGGLFLGYLVLIMILRPPALPLRLAGFFALAVGFFASTLLTTWAFFPLIIPVLMASWRDVAPSVPRTTPVAETDFSEQA